MTAFVTVMLTGCAGPSSPQTTDEGTSENAASEPAFAVDPVAPDPRLDIRWRKGLDPAPLGAYRPRQYGAPVVARGTDRRDVVVGTDDGDLFCLRAGDGMTRWRRSFEGSIQAEPVVTRRQVVVGTTRGVFAGLSRSDGTTLWRYEADTGIDTAPGMGGGVAVATTVSETVIAVDTQSGERAWKYSREKPQKFTVQGGGEPTIHEETVYVGFSDGRFAALNLLDGEPRWVADLSAGSNEYVDIVGRARVYGDRVYALSYAKGLYALKQTDGGVVWRRPFENVSDLELTSDHIYLSIATGRIVAVDTETGETEWGFKFQDNLPAGVRQAGPYLFASTSSGPLYVIDRETGYPFERWRPSNGFGTKAAFGKDAGYVLSNRGYLYRFGVGY